MTAHAPLRGDVLDAHVHVWDLAVNEYPWLGPQHGGLYASFSPEQAQEALAGCGIGAAVLVQAEDSTAETEYMLAVADRHPWVAGVVGWLPWRTRRPRPPPWSGCSGTRASAACGIWCTPIPGPSSSTPPRSGSRCGRWPRRACRSTSPTPFRGT